jgi:hypothetical protein
MPERLVGLLLVLAACGSLALLLSLREYAALLPRPPVAPGLPPQMGFLFEPLTCFGPLLLLGSLGMFLVGLRKLILPDEWRPPRR